MRSQVPCTICGNSIFIPGPNERLTVDGLCPGCATCRSLERHRIIRAVWETVRAHYPLETFACLQFAEDPSIVPKWFGDFYLSVYGGENSMDMQSIPLPDNAVDVVICNHVLEHVADDGKALRELLRVIRPNGFLQIAVPLPLERDTTEDWGYPDEAQHGHYRIYGKDVIALFARNCPGAYLLSVMAKDVCTGVRDIVFFLSHRPVMRPLLSAFVRSHFQRLGEDSFFPVYELGL